MDIRKPKPIHGWREFAIEIGIIVLGISIALAAEQAVEALHSRHTIRELEAAMSLEIGGDDGPQAIERLAISGCLAHRLDALEAALVAERDAGTPFKPAAAYHPPFRTWDADVWRAVLASGASARMSIARLSRWSGPYDELPGLDKENLKEFEDTMELGNLAIVPAHPDGVRRDALLASIQRLRGDNIFLTSASQALLDAAARAGVTISADRARQYLSARHVSYGDCVQIPAALDRLPQARGGTAALDRGAAP